MYFPRNYETNQSNTQKIFVSFKWQQNMHLLDSKNKKKEKKVVLKSGYFFSLKMSSTRKSSPCDVTM